MSDKFSCNACGKLTDMGYFYCPDCHKVHKAAKQRDKAEENTNANEEGRKDAER